MSKTLAELSDELAEVNVRLVRLEVGTEERHKNYAEKHEQLLKQISVVQDNQAWLGRLAIGGFGSIFLAIVTYAFKRGGI